MRALRFNSAVTVRTHGRVRFRFYIPTWYKNQRYQISHRIKHCTIIIWYIYIYLFVRNFIRNKRSSTLESEEEPGQTKYKLIKKKTLSDFRDSISTHVTPHASRVFFLFLIILLYNITIWCVYPYYYLVLYTFRMISHSAYNMPYIILLLYNLKYDVCMHRQGRRQK